MGASAPTAPAPAPRVEEGGGARTSGEPARSLEPGCVNLADLGGLPLKDGRGVTQHGKLFRCAAPASFSEEGLQHLSHDLKITCAVDLRSSREINRGLTSKKAGMIPGAELLTGGANWQNVDLAGKAVKTRLKREISAQSVSKKTKYAMLICCCCWRWLTKEIVKLLRLHPQGDGMTANYRMLLEDGSECIGDALHSLAEKCKLEEPALFHCTAGKDRTGIVAALILKLCGVEDAAIVEDYAASQAALMKFPAVFEKQMPGMKKYLHREIVYESPAVAMEFVLRIIDEEFGGIEEYLQAECDLSKADMEALRNALIAESLA